MAFDGACAGGTVAGTLTLHGQTHPLALEIDRDGGRLHAVGRLHRDTWGMSNDPFSVGHTIRIRVDLPLPPTGGAL